MDSARLAEIVAKVRRIEIRTSRLVTETMAGQYHSVFKGRGMNVEEVREYVPGDEVRTIDWNVTARTGRPFVKKFTEERELTILLLVDVSASERFGSGTTSKRELAAEVASTLALSAIQNHDKVGLVLFTDRVEQYIPPRKGRSHVLRVVREILFFEPAHRGTDLPRALDFANQVVHRRAIAFLLSDFLLPGGFAAGREAFARALRLTNRRHDLIALALHDPREQDLPDVGWVVLEDAESGAQVEVDTGSAAVRQRVAEAAAAERQALAQLFRGAGVDALDLGTAAPYLPTLLRFFRMRARRRS
jgi:uncharacterized protein (DUF58 family)